MDLQSIKTGCEYTYPFRPNIETNFSQRTTAAVLKCWRIYLFPVMNDGAIHNTTFAQCNNPAGAVPITIADAIRAF